MNTNIKILSLTFLVMLPLNTATAAYYRWTDANGIVHYSNSIPASNSQLGHVELTRTGIKKKEVYSANKNILLKKEIERQEQERRAKEKAITAKRIQDAEDNRLLSVFNSEGEVIKSYNAKLRMAQLTIDLLTSRHKSQSSKLEKLEGQFDRTKNLKYRRTIEKQMDNVLDNLRIYQLAITENRIEKEKVKKNFKKTLKKYRKVVARTEATEIVNN